MSNNIIAAEQAGKNGGGGNGSSHSSGNSAAASALVIAATDKAGMDGIDRDRIDAIILRESGNSLYIQQQRRRDEKVNQRIEQMKKKLDAYRPSETFMANLDSTTRRWIAERPSRSCCVVVDMDMFYMACELLTQPWLCNKPACVGGSMILTSNYSARRYGVRSAMAGWIGDCLVRELSSGKEELVHVKANFSLYSEKAMCVRSVLAEYDPKLRAYSLDEAYMDIGPYLAIRLLHSNWTHTEISDTLQMDTSTSEAAFVDCVNHDKGNENSSRHHIVQYNDILTQFTPSICLTEATRVVAAMRQQVFQRTGGLTCSAGLASNFLLAKIASDRKKPNGQCIVPPDHESILTFLHPLPIRKVSGIGRVTEKILTAFNIRTVQELFNQRHLVQFLFTPISAGFLIRSAVGCSSSDGIQSEDDSVEQGQKGISRERTFQAGKSWTEINSLLEDIGRLLAHDMQNKDIHAHTITVKVKLFTFDCLSKSRSMPRDVYVQNAEEIAKQATELLSEIRNDFKGTQFSVRLLGIRCSNFQEDHGRNQKKLDQFLQPVEKNLQRPTVKRHVKSLECQPLVQSSQFLSGFTITKVESARCEQPTLVTRCPLCGRTFMEVENEALNKHIDDCLSGGEIRDAVREETEQAKKRTKRFKKQCLKDFFLT